MRALVALFLLLPSMALAQVPRSCSFVAGQVAASGGATGPAQATWFVVSGEAELVVLGTKFEARLFDSRLNGELSHVLQGTLSSPVSVRTTNSRVLSAALRTIGTDSGDDALSGTFAVATDGAPSARYLSRSLVAHNPWSFVGVTCRERAAT
jgi:hypothetical protein